MKPIILLQNEFYHLFNWLQRLNASISPRHLEYARSCLICMNNNLKMLLTAVKCLNMISGLLLMMDGSLTTNLTSVYIMKAIQLTRDKTILKLNSMLWENLHKYIKELESLPSTNIYIRLVILRLIQWVLRHYQQMEFKLKQLIVQ